MSEQQIPALDRAVVERILRQAVVSLPFLSVLMIDTEARITAVAGGAVAAHGYDPDRLAGSVLSEVLPARAAERLVPLWERALGGESFVDVAPSWDDAAVYETSFGPVMDDGAVVGAVAAVRDVTVERRALAELAASDERHRLLTTHIGDVIAVTSVRDGRYLYVSPSAFVVTGWRADELLDRSVYDLVHPDDVEHVRRERQRVLDGADRATTHSRLRRPDGTWMWVEAQVRALGAAFGPEPTLLATVRDITDRMTAQAELTASNTRFELTFDAAPIGMALVGASGKFVRVNPAMCALLDRAEADVLATTFQELTHPDDLATDEEMLAETIEGRRDGYRMEKRYLRPDGSVVWALLAVSAVREPGRDAFFIAQVEDITARKDALSEMERVATTDHLTGLPNRVLLMDRLRRALVSAHRGGWSVGVLFLDLDRFKQVNDTMGHDAGDELLRQVGERLRWSTREVDTTTRIGGDEFVVVVDRVADVAELHGTADRIRGEFAREFDVFGHRLTVTAAVGVSVGNGSTAEALLREADQAMYREKRHARHALRPHREIDVYSEAMEVLALDQLALHADLRDGIDRGELRVHYQPIVDLRSGAVAAREALVHWQHPRRGLLAPRAFLDGTDRSRLGVLVGEHVLAQVCADAAQWPDVAVAHVDITPRHFADPSLPGYVAGCLERSGLAPEELVLEITESLVLTASSWTLDAARHLTDLGVGLSLDGFGTGYSSVAALHRLPVDSLKIDRSCIAELEHDTAGAAFVEGLIGLAAHMDLDVIADGVDVPEQGEWLAERGCTYGQGRLYGRPAPLGPGTGPR